MAALSDEQVYALARNAGWSELDATIATAIALAESGGDPTAIGDTGITDGTWGPSVGLWQIRSRRADRGTGRTRDATANRDPFVNARHAREVYQEQNWVAWTVFRTGEYQRYLQRARKAAGLDSIGDALSSLASGAAGAVRGAVGNVAGNVVEEITGQALSGARTIAVEGAFVLLGLGLVAAGAWRTVAPNVRRALGV